MFKKISKYLKRKFRKTIYYRDLLNDLTEEVESPSGKYLLTIEHYKTGPKSWNYTKGTVRDLKCKIVGSVYRNYSSFWHCWVEGHPDGHDYLFCGENYQGQTVIQLDTGDRKDFVGIDCRLGGAFCWQEALCSPNNMFLAVNGCFWGCQHEARIIDISDPMNIKDTGRFRGGNRYEVLGWVDDETVSVEYEEEVRKSDGKFTYDLTDEEEEALKAGDIEYRQIKEKIKIKE